MTASSSATKRPWMSPGRLLYALLLVTCWGQPAAATADEPLRIMPLGDSITESGPGDASYRYYLWKFLQEQGIAVDFVGSMTGVRGGAPRYKDFDQQHEGHTGWRTDQVRDRVAAWSAAARPDLVLIHLGTNDLWQGQTVGDTARRIGEVIDELRRVTPGIHVLLAQIIPSPLAPLRNIAALNHALVATARDRSTPASPVMLVDLATGFDPGTMTSDGVHPNDRGERWMAECWGAALLSHLGREIRSGKAD